MLFVSSTTDLVLKAHYLQYYNIHSSTTGMEDSKKRRGSLSTYNVRKTKTSGQRMSFADVQFT